MSGSKKAWREKWLAIEEKGIDSDDSRDSCDLKGVMALRLVMGIKET
jgi:hypothetical protein